MNEPASAQPDVNLVPLTEAGLELELSEMESLSLKMLLDANGIQALVIGASQMPNLPYEIMVPAHQLDEAIRLIRDARQSGVDETEPAAG